MVWLFKQTLAVFQQNRVLNHLQFSRTFNQNTYFVNSVRGAKADSGKEI